MIPMWDIEEKRDQIFIIILIIFFLTRKRDVTIRLGSACLQVCSFCSQLGSFLFWVRASVSPFVASSIVPTVVFVIPVKLYLEYRRLQYVASLGLLRSAHPDVVLVPCLCATDLIEICFSIGLYRGVKIMC